MRNPAPIAKSRVSSLNGIGSWIEDIPFKFNVDAIGNGAFMRQDA